MTSNPLHEPRSIRALRAALAVTLLATLAAGQEGGIEIFAGETLFERGTRVSLTEIYKRKAHLYDGSSRISDPQRRTFEEWRTVVGIDHGVLPDLTVSALVPFVYRELRQTGGDFRARGLGDISLLTKYRVVQEHWRGGSFNVAAVGGLEMPTGDTHETKNGVRLIQDVQVGTGAWNPFVAAAATYGQDRWRADLAAFYKFNTVGAQDLQAGDFLFLRGRVGYRFLEQKYPGPTAAAGIGLVYRHQEEDKGPGVTDSGSNQLHLAVGVGAHPWPQVDLALDVEIPLYQHYSGSQLGRDVLVSLKFGIRF